MTDCGYIMKILNSAYANLKNNRRKINSMNVFPVPDGDTGDNMLMTFESGLNSVKNKEYKSLSGIITDFSSAALMGARGNSGVILSLIIKGFSLAVKDDFNGEVYSKCLKEAVKICYNSVSEPKEGTILTVLRLASEKADKMCRTTKDFRRVFNESFISANAALQKTKELLPVLRQANTVDAGGKGLVCILEGIRIVLEENEEYTPNEEEYSSITPIKTESKIENKYCCECIVSGGDINRLKNNLNSLGDSFIILNENEKIKFHIHSEFPDKVLSASLKEGELHFVKVENMMLQHSLMTFSESKKYAFIAASSGEGVSEALSEMGIDGILESKEKIPAKDVIMKINSVSAENIFLFPNDKNNYLAFKQAKDMTNKNVCLIETSDFTYAISAMMNFDESLSFSENEKNMKNALKNVKSGKVCKADKDLKKIRKGDSLGIINGKIEIREKDEMICVEKVIEKLCDKGYNGVSVFLGDSVGREKANDADKFLNERFSSYDISVIDGKQNIYDYVVMIN